jgi:DNA-directed RNA polymerase specialized sigma24 family protein
MDIGLKAYVMYGDGYSLQQISEALDLSVQQVKRLLSLFAA